MSLIEWKDDYCVGVKELDDQHKKMFIIINDFFLKMKEGLDSKLLDLSLKELVDYGQYHFQTEEKLFERYGYEDRSEHMKLHKHYNEKISDFISKKDDPTVSYEIIDFLEDWWLGHITNVDKKYSGFFQQSGLK